MVLGHFSAKFRLIFGKFGPDFDLWSLWHEPMSASWIFTIRWKIRLRFQWLCSKKLSPPLSWSISKFAGALHLKKIKIPKHADWLLLYWFLQFMPIIIESFFFSQYATNFHHWWHSPLCIHPIDMIHQHRSTLLPVLLYCLVWATGM